MNALARLGYKVYIIDLMITALGIRTLLGSMLKNVHVLGTASRYQDAYDRIGKLSMLPDLVIAEINLGEGVQVDGIKQLLCLYPDVRILVFSSEKEKIFAMRALQAGAVGYLSKLSSFDYIAAQFKRAVDGKIIMSEEVQSMLATNVMGKRDLRSPIDSLTDRELQVLQLIGDGESTRATAAKLHLSIKTIESHRAHIKEKLSLTNGTELTMFAISFGKDS